MEAHAHAYDGTTPASFAAVNDADVDRRARICVRGAASSSMVATKKTFTVARVTSDV